MQHSQTIACAAHKCPPAPACCAAGKPIASLAFHVCADVLAIGCGHKLYMWEYTAQGKGPVIGGCFAALGHAAISLRGHCTCCSPWVLRAGHCVQAQAESMLLDATCAFISGTCMGGNCMKCNHLLVGACLQC